MIHFLRVRCKAFTKSTLNNIFINTQIKLKRKKSRATKDIAQSIMDHIYNCNRV